MKHDILRLKAHIEDSGVELDSANESVREFSRSLAVVQKNCDTARAEVAQLREVLGKVTEAQSEVLHLFRNYVTPRRGSVVTKAIAILAESTALAAPLLKEGACLD